MLSFFPRDVLGEILDLIESVSEGYPTYMYSYWVLNKGRKKLSDVDIQVCIGLF